MEVFSTREIATGIWAIALIIFILYKPNTRRALPGVGRALAHRYVLVTLSLLSIYILFCVWGISQIGLWNASQLKETIIWSFSIALVSLVKTATADPSIRHFRNWAADNLKALVLIEFIVSRYTFSLPIELALIPIATIIGAMAAHTEAKPELRSTRRVINVVLAFMGAALVAFAVFQITQDFASFTSLQTAQDISIAPLLSFLLIPFLFVIHRYAAYEKTFMTLQVILPDDAIRRYAYWRAILSFRTDLTQLVYWRRHIWTPPETSPGLGR